MHHAAKAAKKIEEEKAEKQHKAKHKKIPPPGNSWDDFFERVRDYLSKCLNWTTL
jgi:hypothetical protein